MAIDLQALHAGYQPFELGGMPQQPQKKKKNFFLDQISTVGGIAGGIAGLPLGIIGAGGGAAVGSGLGQALENAITGDKLTKDVGKEAVIGGVLGAGPIRLAKAGLGIGAKVAGNTAKSIAPNIAEQVTQGVTDRAATNIFKLTPAQTAKLLNNGVDPVDLAKVASQYGKSPIEAIGRTGNSGPIQDTIRALESGIQKTATQAGQNIRISGDDFIKALKKEASTIRKEIGGTGRKEQIDKIIADAERKYSKGFTVRGGLNTLRAANEKFGASVIDDTGDAVVTAAHKLEANAIRSALKGRFPSIEKGLDDQSKLIQTRELLKGARAKDITGGFKTGRLDFTRPGTFADPLLNSRTVSNRVIGGAPEASAMTRKGIAGREVAGGLLLGDQSMNSENNPNAIDPTNSQNNIDNMGSLSQTEGDLSSPYSQENLMADIQRDPQHVDDYISYFKGLQEVYATPKEKPLSAAASTTLGNANSGLESLGQLQSMISESGVPKGTLIPGRDKFGGLLANASGSAEYDATSRNVIDAISRLRTGAALTEGEVRFYQSQVPQAFDNPETIQRKIQTLQDFFSSVASRTGSSGGLEDALMQAQGGL